MASQIVSKNLYDLLGNDADQDPDRAPSPPTKAIDKPVQRSGKRNGPADGPANDPLRPSANAAAAARGGRDGDNRRGGFGGDRQQRDGGDRREPREPRGDFEGRGRGRGRGDRGDRRGGRGRGEGRGPRGARGDRQDHSGIAEHEKQAAHGWGGETGNAEWADEQAGSAIAQAEQNNEPGFTPDTSAKDPAFTNGPDAPTGEEDVAATEPEDKTKSYEQYLTELAEKRAALNSGTQEFRKPNEGSKQKFPEGTAFSRNPEEENFFAGSGGKAKKSKDVKEKNKVELDGQYYAAADMGDRGGRGGRGGGRGRGDRDGAPSRGGRGGGDRGGRGGRGRGEGFSGRGGPRGGAPRGGNFDAADSSAFPALGK
ncbi:hypothetical protein LTR62_005412 [Meristemomyces frigidus]|uniref:Hyaluronan/mRNA-binding protein domain-containing protein n=1 Tax=Meristemomyces frigidus TaxID=1508187 RepID=A0AAN7YFH1_9PEZI|nr:hypothetical protein LTR62_005412 [Meristemomyces frigidus]